MKRKTRTKTEDVYAAFTGYHAVEDIGKTDKRLRGDNAVYIGEGIWILPDGTFYHDQEGKQK